MTVAIEFSTSWQEQFLKKLETDDDWSNFSLFQLAYEAAHHLAIPSFSGLVSPQHLPHLTLYPHQLQTAKTVIETMNGKAILADEVGLGKTIEAGLILKEYMIRHLVKKALILVPASLVSQWVTELNEKFYIPAVAQRKSYIWEQGEIVIASLDTAKREPHASIILEQEYDLVIVDEAHKLKNAKTKNYQFIKQIKKKFCLLLTATPVQNRLDELFNLVSLLKPGHFGDVHTFEKNFREKKNERRAKNEEKLKALLQKVMVRNRREDTTIEWTKRIVSSVEITFSEQERQFYDQIASLKERINPLSFLTLQREICSSKEAAFMTLKNLYEQAQENREDVTLYEQLFTTLTTIQTNAKAEKALEIIKEVNDKVIIFTEYRATQLYLQWFLKQHGISSVPFRGGFKAGKKDWMRQLFEHHAQVLIATEAGGEGINLQFCSHMINYDLPWNPMRIEQRIGRIHRFGQKQHVHIYNFAVKDTIEQQMLTLLYEKLALFESVVGEVDAILAKLELTSIEEHVQDIFLHSESEAEMKIKLDHLQAIIEQIQAEEEEKNRAAT